MSSIIQKIWIEEVLPDSIRANLITTPDARLIASTTSNYQRQPGAIVLLDHKYPIVGLQDVEVTRGRDTSSNVARFTLMNMDTRYSGPNRHKIAANVPVSIYLGYDGKYLQKYEGFIDTVTMNTTRTGSLITINCRDRAKLFLEQTISAGIYSDVSGYLGFGDWHFAPEWTPMGVLLKQPKEWTVSEIITDVCYCMGLKDAAEFITIEEEELPSGAYRYNREVVFRSEFEIDVAEEFDRVLVTNFIEEHPLDCLSKLAQSILHEVIFDTDGILRVRPVKNATSPSRYYFKEERDISSITENTDDDSVINITTIIGQTANETAIIYPFAPIAVKENIQISKGQDLYGQAITYPAIVSPESVDNLQRHLSYAPVIHPGGATFEPINNPENRPQYDIRIKYPNFANGHKKQKALEATCPIVTDTADWAATGNRRLWMFYGAIEEALAYEKQPITLKDRFGQDVLVVCKQRSMDKALIRKCGNEPFDGVARPEGDDPLVPSPIASEKVQWHGTTLAAHGGEIRVVKQDDPALIPDPFTPIYRGIPSFSSSFKGERETIIGWEKRTEPLPDSAPLPIAFDEATIAHLYDIRTLTVGRGADLSSPDDDLISLYYSFTNVVFFTCKKEVEIIVYRDPDPESTLTVDVLATPESELYEYDSIDFHPNFLLAPRTVNCEIELADISGVYKVTVNDVLTVAPAGWEIGTSKFKTIEYPAILFSSTKSLSGAQQWRFVTWNHDFQVTADLITESKNNNCELLAYSEQAPIWFATQGDPDTNCIYWAWHGGYNNESASAGLNALPPNSILSSNALLYAPSGAPIFKGYTEYATHTKWTDGGSITYSKGCDWTGCAPALIHKESFYKYAQDPNTVVIDLVTAGIQLKSWAELIKFNENFVEARGYNQYGNMESEMRELMDSIQTMFIAVAAAILFLAMATWKAHFGAGMAVEGILAILVVMYILIANLGGDVGRNISKVMEDLTCNVYAVRKEEIHLPHNAQQAAAWQLVTDMNPETGAWHVPDGDMIHSKFYYEDDDGRPCWVYIMNVSAPGKSDLHEIFRNGAWVTAFGWETPEIRDRYLIDYYENLTGDPAKDVRREMTMQFSIEAFGDDTTLNMTATELMAKRFERASFGTPRVPGDTWMQSSAYEVLVDRSMTDIAVTDTGWWWEFFERRDNYTPRIYKYVAVVIYDIKETQWKKNTGSRIGNPVQHIVAGSTPNDDYVFSKKRWGFYVPRGLNASWYAKYRWLEKRNEQNYLNFRILHAGQSQLVAHIYNNFRYSALSMDIRIWGKAYGKFAPSIVYFHETDQMSIGSYGMRELRLVNNCINTFKVARYIATKLASQSAHAYVLEVTGKPHIKEGDVITVKEETTGAVAGMFRTWENVFKDPQTRTCTHPANMLQVDEIGGVYLPQMAIATHKNNTLVACGDQTRQAYIVELDKASNPVWWAKTPDPATPSFVLRWNGADASTGAVQSKTIVGLRYNQTVAIIDYAKALVVERFFFASDVLCACMDEEQRFLYIGTGTGVSCIDMQTWSIRYMNNTIGPVYGIAATNCQMWDTASRDYRYKQHGILFCLTNTGIQTYQLFASSARTALGPLLTTFTDIPLDNPSSISYDKFIDELVYVNAGSADTAASIIGLNVEVEVSPDNPELGIEVEFVERLWSVDFMDDAELVHTIPDSVNRKLYIDQFFKPVHAIRDVNRDLLVTDREHNKIYRINPSGKLYVTKITDRWARSNDADEYRNNIEAVPIEAAISLQLTNFGQNFLSERTDEQIEGSASMSMGRIIQMLPRNRYLIKLLTSQTVVEAYNNSLDGDLRIHDTVLIAYNYGDRGMCAIVAKKSLWDWTIETGDPYISVDATSIDLSKYGQDASNTSGGGSGGADMGPLFSRIRVLEQKIRQLGGFHGITW